MLADEISTSRSCRERRRWVAPGKAGLDRAAFRRPFVDTAVEHGGAVEAKRPQHPPEPRGPHRRPDRIEHHAAVIPDAVATERSFELPDARHHEAKLGGGIGKFVLQIEKI